MTAETVPRLSALQASIQQKTSSASPHADHLQHLALQIKHDLQYQHRWTDLQIHHYRPDAHNASGGAPALAGTVAKRKRTPLPRPMISGLPPRRLYVHPDEQIAMLQAARKQKPVATTAAEDEAASRQSLPHGDDVDSADAPGREAADAAMTAAQLAAVTKVEPEREWVLPTHLKETWTLRRLGEVFDAIGFVPPDVREDGHEDDLEDGGGQEEELITPATIAGMINPWREKKRVLLAILDDDSTIVYYIVHDGIVKPRQN